MMQRGAITVSRSWDGRKLAADFAALLAEPPQAHPAPQTPDQETHLHLPNVVVESLQYPITQHKPADMDSAWLAKFWKPPKRR